MTGHDFSWPNDCASCRRPPSPLAVRLIALMYLPTRGFAYLAGIWSPLQRHLSAPISGGLTFFVGLRSFPRLVFGTLGGYPARFGGSPLRLRSASGRQRGQRRQKALVERGRGEQIARTLLKTPSVRTAPSASSTSCRSVGGALIQGSVLGLRSCRWLLRPTISRPSSCVCRI
jgi:hypothetical protein